MEKNKKLKPQHVKYYKSTETGSVMTGPNATGEIIVTAKNVEKIPLHSRLTLWDSTGKSLTSGILLKHEDLFELREGEEDVDKVIGRSSSVAQLLQLIDRNNVVDGGKDEAIKVTYRKK